MGAATFWVVMACDTQVVSGQEFNCGAATSMCMTPDWGDCSAFVLPSSISVPHGFTHNTGAVTCNYYMAEGLQSACKKGCLAIHKDLPGVCSERDCSGVR